MLAVCALLAAALPGGALGQRFQRQEPPPVGRWYVVDREDGITVQAKEREEHDLPLLRATGTVQAGLYEIAAVLWDAEDLDRWMAFTAESRLIERTGELGFIFYQRMGAPWPVSDRDAVISVNVQLDAEKGRLVSRFRNVRDRRVGPVSGVVRMPRLSGYYDLQAVAADRTHVRLLIDADPGGGLPRWLVRAVSRQLPLEMLTTLRERVAHVGSRYSRLVATWESRHGPMQPRR